jgi:glycosyltransferase involved in cell wall biosynthesis
MKPLAIISPQVGSRSETFVRRHMEDLVPGGTVVLSSKPEPPFGGHWDVTAPFLRLDKQRRGSWLENGIRWKLGLPTPQSAAAERFLRHHHVRTCLVEYLDVALHWLPVAQRCGLRFFAHAHGYDVSVRLRDPAWREKYRALDKADGLITVSALSRERLIALGLNGARIHVIPCGVDVPREVLTRPTREAVRCLAVGRMAPKKGPIFTLDAFRRAAEVRPELRLDFIGEGPLLPAAEQYVAALQLGDRVTLHGGQPADAVQRLLGEADIFLHHAVTDPASGDEEGLPVAILEAMAVGLPVVSTQHAGIPEAVEDGVTGWLVPERDTPAMAVRIVELARSSELRARLGEAGWRCAGARFSWERERAALLRLIGLDLSPGAD